MTTEKSGTNGQEEQRTVEPRCSLRECVKMLANCCKEMKRGCGEKMQEMMKGGCCQPEKK